MLNTKEVDVSLFRVPQYVVLEITPTHNNFNTYKINAELKWILNTIKASNNIDTILTQAVNCFRKVVDFDRVKALRFYPDYSGEIVAESSNGKMDSYLGLNFPAADLPVIARKLLEKINIRHIQNTADNGVKIFSSSKTLPDLNLTQSLLRGNSLIHNQYLRNMGVSSTITIPILFKGKLWGLFSFHNKATKSLTAEVVSALEVIGQVINMLIEEKIKKNTEKKISNLYLNGEEFVTLNQNALYLQKFWSAHAKKLKALIECDGVAYSIDKKILVYGNCPSKNSIASLSQHLSAEKHIFYTTNITSLSSEDFGTSRGLLALCVNHGNPNICIYFFRNAIEQNINWAGNPKKDISFTKEKIRLHPRSSFNEFIENNKEHSKLWDSQTLTLAEAALETFKKAVYIEKISTERLRIVIQELNHRLRNILALVRSISRQTADPKISIENYTNSLEKRILALAEANNLLTDNFYNAVSIRAIFKKVIFSIYNNQDKVTLEGMEVKLTSEITPMIVLIIHELSTNAVKYGALSVAKGHVKINWEIKDKGLCITWEELNGPKVTPPKQFGFGTTIIKNAISYEFDGTSKIEFNDTGIKVSLEIPHHLIGENKDPVFVLEQVEDLALLKNENETLKTFNVLILEDDFINAWDMEKSISSISTHVVKSFAKQEDALLALDKDSYQLALLDVNLKNETCVDVAKACSKKNIPFYYITGYGKSFLKEKAFPLAPILLKPITAETLQEIISKNFSDNDNAYQHKKDFNC